MKQPLSVRAFERHPCLSTAWPLIRDALLHPMATFSNIDPVGSCRPALAFGLVTGWIGLAIELSSLRASLIDLSTRFPEAFQNIAKTIPELLAKMPFSDWISPVAQDNVRPWLAIWVLGFPCVVVTLLATCTAIHVCLRLLGAGSGGYTATARVVAYSGSCALVAWIPVVGDLLALGLVTVQQLTGLPAVHRASVGRVTMAISLPFILAMVLLGVVSIWSLTALR